VLDSLARALERKFDVVMPDARAHGGSSAPHRTASTECSSSPRLAYFVEGAVRFGSLDRLCAAAIEYAGHADYDQLAAKTSPRRIPTAEQGQAAHYVL